ncbi:ARS-binding protein 1 [Phytophthora citrophthora]|uniref:ARS-binding protein 1 n=1 Tax=Phytophthora citrophthora TaxID=4793 RepID=A0AAD9G3F9_9STRA|nr:ARS-binding protein 1 [Phytophthora citrophthora]
MAVARHHLTIHEKNQLRVYHRERPDLTQEQLREWVHAHFGKWIGRSTIGKIASQPEEVCANPTAKRIQSGRYPEMEAELYAFVMSKDDEESLHSEQAIMSEGLLWTKANEILMRTRGPTQSVSLGWVQRFKKRHGLHRSQKAGKNVEMAQDLGLETITETVPVTFDDSSSVGEKRRLEVDEPDLSLIAPSKKAAVAPKTTPGRKQFVSADDILLLTQVLITKPWAYPQLMDGWQEVCEQLREHSAFNLEKTAGACQARMLLLLDHLRAGNVAALRKSGTSEEYERKRELLVEVQAKQTAFEEFQDDLRKRRGDPALPSTVTQHEAAVAKVGRVAAAIAVKEATGEADLDGQRRLELLEMKMERELAEQRRYADEQVRQLERLQRAQLEAQQSQHAQLLATIQQQQATMLDLIKSVAAQSKKD